MTARAKSPTGATLVKVRDDPGDTRSEVHVERNLVKAIPSPTPNKKRDVGIAQIPPHRMLTKR